MKRTRNTTKRGMADVIKNTPNSEPDNGALTRKQYQQIAKLVPQGQKRSVSSSLFDSAVADVLTLQQRIELFDRARHGGEK